MSDLQVDYYRLQQSVAFDVLGIATLGRPGRLRRRSSWRWVPASAAASTPGAPATTDSAEGRSS